MIDHSQLTERQRQVLDFIREFIARHSYSPSMREIGDGIGINSTNGVVCHLVALERKGHIRMEKNRARSIVLAESEVDLLRSRVAELEAENAFLKGKING
jgi:repressor LexA